MPVFTYFARNYANMCLTIYFCSYCEQKQVQQPLYCNIRDVSIIVYQREVLTKVYCFLSTKANIACTHCLPGLFWKAQYDIQSFQCMLTEYCHLVILPLCHKLLLPILPAGTDYASYYAGRLGSSLSSGRMLEQVAKQGGCWRGSLSHDHALSRSLGLVQLQSAIICYIIWSSCIYRLTLKTSTDENTDW